MRSIFSLAGILVVAGVIMWVYSRTEIPTLKQSENATNQAQQLSGHDTDGTPVAQTMTLEAHSTNNKLDGILVKDVLAGGAMERAYGLQKGDLMVQIGPMDVQSWNNDGELAISLAQQAYQQSQTIVVMRNGQRVELAPKP
jgi:type II secretory pathway component PulC